MEGNPCYKVVQNLAELCSGILRTVELIYNKRGYLTEKISQQSVQVWPGFSLLFIVKHEADKLKKELLIKNKLEPEDLENPQPIHIGKNKKACFEENGCG